MEESNATGPAQSFKMKPKSLVTNFQCFMLLLIKKKKSQEKKKKGHREVIKCPSIYENPVL